MARIYPIHHPEIRLMALLIVATKICFPFQGNRLPIYMDGASILPIFDWNVWRDEMAASENQDDEPLNYANVKPSQVAAMSDKELAKYFEHVSSYIEAKSTLPTP